MSEHIHGATLLASLSRFTQDTRLLRLTTPLGEDLIAECMHGEEGISEAYVFKIDALGTDVQLQLRSLIGQPALLQLFTAESFSSLRPFHGYITSAEITGANGGFVRYVLTIEPWCKFLSLGRDSRSFQDMTVFDILDVVFGSYSGRGKLVCEWRFDIVDQSVYPKRSLSTQYQESDLAFAQRLLIEEGLSYFFEHSGDPDSASLGSHTMVIADHNGAFAPNPQSSVEFTRPGAVMKTDSIDRWRTETRVSTNAVEIGSWDYRTARQQYLLSKYFKFSQTPRERHFAVFVVFALALMPMMGSVREFTGVPFAQVFLLVAMVPVSWMSFGFAIRAWLVCYFYPAKIKKSTGKDVYVDIVTAHRRLDK